MRPRVPRIDAALLVLVTLTAAAGGFLVLWLLLVWLIWFRNFREVVVG